MLIMKQIIYNIIHQHDTSNAASFNWKWLEVLNYRLCDDENMGYIIFVTPVYKYKNIK